MHPPNGHWTSIVETLRPSPGRFFAPWFFWTGRSRLPMLWAGGNKR